MTTPATMIGLLGVTGVGVTRESELIVALLILLLGMALGIGVTCLFVVVHFLRKGQLANRPAVGRFGSRVKSVGRGQVGRLQLMRRPRKLAVPMYNLPSCWLAVRTENPHWVQAALGLNNPTPCSWEEGLSGAHERELFISPPIRGWVLVMGRNLPEPDDDVDRCYRFILELSRRLGHVQFFSVNRAVNHHAWVQADRGTVRRGYAWAGKTLWNQGRMCRAEIDLGMKCFEYGEGEQLSGLGQPEFGQPNVAALNTDRVPLLAACWSLDPASIDARMLKRSSGIAGQLSSSRVL